MIKYARRIQLEFVNLYAANYHLSMAKLTIPPDKIRIIN